jgi:hypothetical protein
MAWAAASAELLAPDNDRKQNDRWEWVACNDGAELSLLSPMIAPNVCFSNEGRFQDQYYHSTIRVALFPLRDDNIFEDWSGILSRLVFLLKNGKTRSLQNLKTQKQKLWVMIWPTQISNRFKTSGKNKSMDKKPEIRRDNCKNS